MHLFRKEDFVGLIPTANFNKKGNNKMIAEFVYFKESGKYYSKGILRVKDEYGNLDERFLDCIYPKDFGLRALELKILPDLASGVWNGPFLVIAPYPELVMQ